jgi:hypothetical protein
MILEIIGSIPGGIERYKFLPHMSSFLSHILSLFSRKGLMKKVHCRETGKEQSERKVM